MLDETTLIWLIHKIYETPTRPDAWTEVNAALRDLLGATACAMGVFNFRAHDGLLCLSSGLGSDFLESYRDRYAPLDVWLRREAAYRVPGTVHVGQELVPESEVKVSRFYREWLKPQNLFHRLSLVLVREEANLCYFAMLRPPRERAFGDHEVAICRVLAPHLRRAVQLHDRLAAIEWERDAAIEVLNRLPTGVVLCDRTGEPVVVNEAGRQDRDER